MVAGASAIGRGKSFPWPSSRWSSFVLVGPNSAVLKRSHMWQSSLIALPSPLSCPTSPEENPGAPQPVSPQTPSNSVFLSLRTALFTPRPSPIARRCPSTTAFSQSVRHAAREIGFANDVQSRRADSDFTGADRRGNQAFVDRVPGDTFQPSGLNLS